MWVMKKTGAVPPMVGTADPVNKQWVDFRPDGVLSIQCLELASLKDSAARMRYLIPPTPDLTPFLGSSAGDNPSQFPAQHPTSFLLENRPQAAFGQREPDVALIHWSLCVFLNLLLLHETVI